MAKRLQVDGRSGAEIAELILQRLQQVIADPTGDEKRRYAKR